MAAGNTKPAAPSPPVVGIFGGGPLLASHVNTLRRANLLGAVCAARRPHKVVGDAAMSETEFWRQSLTGLVLLQAPPAQARRALEIARARNLIVLREPTLAKSAVEPRVFYSYPWVYHPTVCHVVGHQKTKATITLAYPARWLDRRHANPMLAGPGLQALAFAGQLARSRTAGFTTAVRHASHDLLELSCHGRDFDLEIVCHDHAEDDAPKLEASGITGWMTGVDTHLLQAIRVFGGTGLADDIFHQFVLRLTADGMAATAAPRISQTAAQLSVSYTLLLDLRRPGGSDVRCCALPATTDDEARSTVRAALATTRAAHPTATITVLDLLRVDRSRIELPTSLRKPWTATTPY